MLKEMQINLRAFVAEGSGLESKNVIPANDSNPVPLDPFATVLVVDETDRSYFDRIERDTNFTYTNNERTGVEDTDIREDLSVQRRARVSVQFMRRGAVDNLDDFILFIGSTDSLILEEGYGFRTQMPYEQRRLDTVISDRYEERAGIDLVVDYVRISSRVLIPVERIPVTISEGDITLEDTVDGS